MVTGKPWRQGHHSLAGEAVHSSELVHHLSIPQSHLLAVHLHQRSGADHHQLPGSSQPRVAPPDGLAGLYCLSEYPTRLETAYHPIYALGREGSAFLGPQCPQLLPSPAGVLLPDGPGPSLPPPSTPEAVSPSWVSYSQAPALSLHRSCRRVPTSLWCQDCTQSDGLSTALSLHACSSNHRTTFHRRLASIEGSAGSRANLAAPGSMAPYTLILTPAYLPFISLAGVRHLSDPNQQEILVR